MAGYDKPCIGCGEFIGYDNSFCPVCGRISPFYDACPSCAAEIKRQWKRCPSCGRDLNITCPFCGQMSYVSDKCDACHASLVIKCENALCGAQQFFENIKCTQCGKSLKIKAGGNNAMMQAFTRNYEDNSTDAGFQFTFYCDICRDGFRSSFIESASYKKGNFLKGLTRGIGTAATMFGGAVGRVGHMTYGAEHILSERFQGMSPEWHKEHEKAFSMAQNEAKQHFHRCHKCHKWVCDTCNNDEVGLCAECAPRVNVEVAAARADKMKRDIWDKAEQTQVFQGDIEQKATFCPHCGKPAGQSKFCTNCGGNLALNICSTCGAENDQSVRFCGECGTKLK